MNYKLTPTYQPVDVAIALSGSKSISNRILLLNAVGGMHLLLRNLSAAQDTVVLKQALDQIQQGGNACIDIHHAGTDMRFLTAYLACTPGEWVLTGSDRMKQRPIGELVAALVALGADVDYLEQEGFPPLKIKGKHLEGGRININATVSSQFISALLLVAPLFKKGLTLYVQGEPVSWPYVQMTVNLLKQLGALVEEQGTEITVSCSALHYAHTAFVVESDWSSASYWFSFVALAPDAQVTLTHLFTPSWQADSVLPDIYSALGVQCEYTSGGLTLYKAKVALQRFEYDFTDCPDIAQTVAVTCLGLGIPAMLTGLQTLKLKETDRITALKNELEKFGARVDVTADSMLIEPGEYKANEPVRIRTYNDHRMAMCMAPLALRYGALIIEDGSVTDKSYPDFWKDVAASGIVAVEVE